MNYQGTLILYQQWLWFRKDEIHDGCEDEAKPKTAITKNALPATISVAFCSFWSPWSVRCVYLSYSHLWRHSTRRGSRCQHRRRAWGRPGTMRRRWPGPGAPSARAGSRRWWCCTRGWCPAHVARGALSQTEHFYTLIAATRRWPPWLNKLILWRNIIKYSLVVDRVNVVVIDRWCNGLLTFVVILLLSSLWFIWNNCICKLPASNIKKGPITPGLLYLYYYTTIAYYIINTGSELLVLCVRCSNVNIGLIGHFKVAIAFT